MANYSVEYPYQSSNLYSITFEYLDREDVKVSVNGVDTTDPSSTYTFAFQNDTQISLTPNSGIVGNGVRVYRETNTDQLDVTFFPGSAIRAADLNKNFEQNNFATQEVKERFLDRTGGTMSGQLDMGTNKIVNLGTPTADTDAATKKYIDDVAIAGIGPGTARQLLQTNAGATAVEFTSNIDIPGTLDVTGLTSFNTTDSIVVARGTTAQRSGSPVNGMFRYNTDLSTFEGYSGGAWGSVGGGATGGATDDVFYENGQTVTTNYTLTTNKNAVSAGPITINSGVTVTVPAGQSWVIV